MSTNASSPALAEKLPFRQWTGLPGSIFHQYARRSDSFSCGDTAGIRRRMEGILLYGKRYRCFPGDLFDAGTEAVCHPAGPEICQSGKGVAGRHIERQQHDRLFGNQLYKKSVSRREICGCLLCHCESCVTAMNCKELTGDMRQAVGFICFVNKKTG